MAANESIADLQRKKMEAEAGGPSLAPLPAQTPTRTATEPASTAVPAANQIALIDKALVKAGSTRLVTYNIHNPNAAVAFVQLLNSAAAATPVLGTTVPLAWFAVPAGGVLDGAWATSEPFNLGLVIAATTTPTGSTLVAAGLAVSLQVV
jgi:hypothetical protein